MKVFIENQRFNQWWLFVILAIPLVSVFVAFISKEENELSKSHLIIFLASLIFIMLIDIFIFSIQLKTRIDENGVHYQFFPFNLKLRLIPWNEIENCYCRKYKPISEYGGWGFRVSSRNGKALNIKGEMGIQIILKNDKKLLLGTQKPNEVKMVLDTYKYKIIPSNPINSI